MKAYFILIVMLYGQLILNAQLNVYNDNNTIITSSWNGNGILSQTTSNLPCEGSNHYQFQYSLESWWAGFGLNFNNWATLPGVKYDLTNYNTIRLSYKGLGGLHQLSVKLRNRYSTITPISSEVSIGSSASQCTLIDIPITSLVSGTSFDISSVTDIEFSVGGAMTGNGIVYIDDISILPNCVSEVSNILNSGTGSLRNAINCIEDNSIITIDASLMGQAIQLDNTPLQINKNLTLSNQNNRKLSITSAPGFPMFEVAAGKTLTVTNIDLIANGNSPFTNRGTIKLNDLDVTMQNDTALNTYGNVLVGGNVKVKWSPAPNIIEELSNFIVVDQFGYRTNAKKVAIIRSPVTGYDNAQGYIPSNIFALKNVNTSQEVFTSAISSWNSGATDPASGDRVWWFDFSQVVVPGTYYVVDKGTGKRSFNFVIGNDVYKNVLKAAFKTFYYQRAGYAKLATYAGATWADSASHMQDQTSRSFLDKTNPSTEKDLSGGWYDAGDYNKYTAWHASYILSLLQMYRENPSVWTDDFGIPESGNGIPDILDEINFGLQWLYKMQQSDGSCLSVLDVATASPPSAASGASYYGLASTFATLRSAETFSYAVYVFSTVPALSAQSSGLITKATSAWTWANANPAVLFPNNMSINNTVGLAAGNQETDEIGRQTAKLGASLYLYLATNNVTYKNYFEANYTQMPLLLYNNFVSQYFFEQQDILLEYCGLANATPSIVSVIKNATNTGMKKSGDFANIVLNNGSAYKAFIKDYNWGSNNYKSIYGNFYNLVITHNIDPPNNTSYRTAAESYLHYIHGTNPFNMVYLSKMTNLGADKQISQFYHSWFADQSPWDVTPAPGFLVGGPNQFYTIDECCPGGCGGTANNARCTSENLNPPLNQPPMKSYKDFNTSWPLNSWQISENSNSYQVAYLRLLSKFLD